MHTEPIRLELKGKDKDNKPIPSKHDTIFSRGQQLEFPDISAPSKQYLKLAASLICLISRVC